MSADWEKYKAAAMKVLGKDGDIPDRPAAMDKASDKFNAAFADFTKACNDLESKILTLENSNDEIKNVTKQFEALISKSDLGLDSSNKDDAKKIAQARKILLDRLAAAKKDQQSNEKILDELDKHVIQLGKYKPQT